METLALRARVPTSIPRSPKLPLVLLGPHGKLKTAGVCYCYAVSFCLFIPVAYRMWGQVQDSADQKHILRWQVLRGVLVWLDI